MQADAILVDDTPRGIIHRYFYPLAYVQAFRPCSWDNLREYICEGEVFRDIIVERWMWTKDHQIKCHMNYQTFQCDPNLPPEYRLFTCFGREEQAQAYLQRWT